jgi:hypothetical protein
MILTKDNSVIVDKNNRIGLNACPKNKIKVLGEDLYVEPQSLCDKLNTIIISNCKLQQGYANMYKSPEGGMIIRFYKRLADNSLKLVNVKFTREGESWKCDEMKDETFPQICYPSDA